MSDHSLGRGSANRGIIHLAGDGGRGQGASGYRSRSRSRSYLRQQVERLVCFEALKIHALASVATILFANASCGQIADPYNPVLRNEKRV